MIRRTLFCVVGLYAFAGCAAPAPEPATSTTAEIVGGEVGGPSAVVAIQNFASGGLCTGTLIAERVVLTAKHCVQAPFDEGPASPSQFIVGVGNNIRRLSTTLRVQSISTTPGIYTEDARGSVGRDLIGKDVAVMVLQSGAPGVPTIDISREDHRGLTGQTVTAVGFGRTPSGQVGQKYINDGRITGTDSSLIFVGALTCQGDSGGPALIGESPDWVVAGVTSFGAGECGSGYGAYQAISPFLELIDAALLEAGSCLNDGEERCDGADNDCDDLVDETCTPIGGDCTSDTQCVGLTCRVTDAGRICTAPCDPLRPATGCEAGLFCSGTDCEGFCVPMTGAAELPIDADCTAHDQCQTFYCGDPGDGRMRCLPPCRGDEGMCLGGEACAATAGACGGCIPADVLSAARGLGEACADATECVSGNCLDDAGRLYCTRDCAADSECPRGYHCRDGSVCASGPRAAVGGVCVTSGDCVEGLFCATAGSRSWCTELCTDDCPDGLACVPAGGTMVCAPDLGLLGDGCVVNEDCVSGLCVEAGEMGSQCSQMCGVDAVCGAGFECRRTADGLGAVCLRPLGEADGGGCSVSAGVRSRVPLGLWMLGLCAAALVRIRRRQ